MHLGYARVSTGDQNPDFQLSALKQAGCTRLFQPGSQSALPLGTMIRASFTISGVLLDVDPSAY